MKKNFVKKTLASTLALAMVATATPAAFTTASAAAAPKFNKTSKTLYINENEIGSSFDFNISNKVAGSKYKWTTSNKAVATVNSVGLTKAGTKTGTATIKCKITFKTKKTKTLSAKVTVKENATKVECTNVPENNTIGMAGYDFNSKMTSASGAKATDYRRWEVSEEGNTAKATIDAKSGVVTVANAGEFKVRVVAYQNKTKLAANDVVASDWMTIKVKASVVSTVQTTATKVAVTFDDVMKDKVKASDFVIENQANHVKPAIKDLSFSEDGKVVILETYQSFEDGKTYSVTYDGTAYNFTTSIGDVATLEITTTTAVVDTDQEIKFVLKNANGVDITDLKKGNVTFEEVENNKGFFDAANTKVRLWEKGAVAKFKATYHTYDYNADGTEKGAVTVEFSVVAVEASAVTYGTMKYTITDNAAAPNWDKVTETTTKLAIGDEGKYVHVYAKGSDDSTLSGVKFESGNTNVLLVNENDGSLTPVKEGVAHVIVKKDDKIIGTCAVTVLAERKATSITLATNSITVSNSSNLDAEKVAITLKDQHGDKMKDSAYADLTVEKVKTANPDIVSVVGKDVVIDADGIADGTYQYKIKIDSNKLTVLTVVVKKYDSSKAIASYKLQLSAQTVDTVVTADSKDTQKVDISLAAYNTDGVKANMADFKVVVTKPDGKVDEAFTASGATSYSYNVRTFDTSGTAKKVATGTYKVSAYVWNETKQIFELKGNQFFKVEDTQVAPTVKLDKQNSDVATDSDVVTVINAAFVIKDTNGKQYGKDSDCAIVDVRVDESKASDYYLTNGKTVYVKKVIVREEIATNVYVDHEVTVGQSVYTK